MNTPEGPYQKWVGVSLAADAVSNQAYTRMEAVHEAVDRAKAFRAKLAARAADKS